MLGSTQNRKRKGAFRLTTGCSILALALMLPLVSGCTYALLAVLIAGCPEEGTVVNVGDGVTLTITLEEQMPDSRPSDPVYSTTASDNATVTDGDTASPTVTVNSVGDGSVTVTVTVTVGESSQEATCTFTVEAAACETDDECEDDGDACTIEACEDGACTSTDVACEEGETCVDGVCITTCETDADCDDGDNCTTDTCDTDSSTCSNEAVVCEAPDACTDSACDADTGECVDTEIDCDDGLDCTDDSCDEADGCQNVSNCDEGLVCGADGCLECYEDTDCGENETCTDNVCTPIGDDLAVDAGDDQTVQISESVTLTCTQTDGGDPATLSWAQTSGTSVTLTDNGDGTASFTAPSAEGVELVFECTGTRGEGEDVQTATDTVTVTTEVGDISVFCVSDRVFNLDATAFNSGSTVQSANTLSGDSDNPGGLSATATSSQVENPTNISISWECVSGPAGASACDDVTIINSTVANNGTVAQYNIAPGGSGVTLIQGTGATTTDSNVVSPGPYTFQATATAAGVGQATCQLTYTINTGFQVLSRAADGTSFATTDFYNDGATNDEFPAGSSDFAANTTNALQGVVLAQGQLTNRVLKPGASITVPFSVLAKEDGDVNFSLRNVSGDSLGTDITQTSTSVTASADTLVTVNAGITAPTTAATYFVRAAWDSSAGSEGDTSATHTDLIIHVQPDVSSLQSTTLTVTQQNGALAAINNQTSAAVKMHGGASDATAGADVGDEVGGNLVAECDVNNDGTMELVVIDSEPGAGSEEFRLFYTTADPTNNLKANHHFNRGFLITADFPSTVDLEVDAVTLFDAENGTTTLADTHLATAIACGDVNGDNFVDLAIGHATTDVDSDNLGYEGSVSLFYHLGDTSGKSTDDRTKYALDPWEEDARSGSSTDNGQVLFRAQAAGTHGYLFGYSLLFANFVGSAADELFVGAPLEDATDNDVDDGDANHGAVYVYGVGQQAGVTIDLGGAVTNIEIAAGNPGGAGVAGTSGLIAAFEPATTNHDGCGAAIAAGDWSTIGSDSAYMDIAVGCPGKQTTTEEGSVFVFGGASSLTKSDGQFGTSDFTAEYVGEANDVIGRRLAVCDFDGNGTDDLIVSGADEATLSATTPGTIYAILNGQGTISGATDLVTITSTVSIDGGSGNNLGWRLDCGDINGDGFDDIAASNYGVNGATNDEVWVVLGTSSPTTSATLTSPDLKLDGVTGANLTIDDVVQGFTGVDEDANTHAANFDLRTLDAYVNVPGEVVAIVDINGDGEKDLIANDASADTNGVLFWLCGREGGE